MSTKFNALPAFGIFAALWSVFLPWRKERALRLSGAIGIVCAAAFVVYLPWLAKNFSETGNPLFPLFKGWFGPIAPPAPPLDGDLPRGLTWLEQRRWLYHESWLEILFLPIRVFLQGRDENPALFDGRLSPVLLTAALTLFLPKARRAEKLLCWYSVAYLLVALVMGGGRVRYLTPVIGPLAALAACSIGGEASKLSAVSSRALLAALVAFQSLWSLHYTLTSAKLLDGVRYYRGQLTAPQYLERNISDYAAIQYINTDLPEDATIYLLLTGNRFYYFNRRVVSSGHYSGSEILRWLLQSKTPEEFRKEFSNRGVGYVMAHLDRTARLLGDLSEDKKVLWNEFQKRFIVPRFESGGYIVWELRA